MRLETVLISAVAIIALGACGASDEMGVSSSKTSAATDCPPEQKGNGIMVSSRYDIDDVMAANSWRDEMYSKACAGDLAAYVPNMPDGFGLVPTVQPYIMNNDQVYLHYGEIPTKRIDEMSGQPNVPRDMDSIDIEIRRFSADELAVARRWLAENPSEYFTAEIDSQPVYMINGLGMDRIGKGDKLLTALHAFLDEGVVLRVHHSSLYSQHGGVSISPLVETVMSDMLNNDQ